jgi:hypothetical protein
MNINPNGYDGGDVMGFQDPSPSLEGCDQMNCTAPVGGEHAPTCDAYAADYRCYICKRILGEHDADWTLFDYGLHVERICDNCREKGDEGIDIPLDYTEDEA